MQAKQRNNMPMPRIDSELQNMQYRGIPHVRANREKEMHDCIYYWSGGTERGQWHRAEITAYDAVTRQGYVVVKGKTSIGAPEGAPVRQLKEMDDALKMRWKVSGK